MKLYGSLWPTFRFRWQSDPQEKLARYLQEQPEKPALAAIDLTVDRVSDYPRYRGLWGDGVVNPAELLDMKWESGPPREVWRHPCGGGFAGFAVAGNVAVTLEQRGEEETVVCYDRATGQQRWAFGHEADFRHPVGPCLTFNPDEPYDGLACRPQWLFGLLARHGFVIEIVRLGNWRQVRSYKGSQDYVVARRPPGSAAPPPHSGPRSPQS